MRQNLLELQEFIIYFNSKITHKFTIIVRDFNITHSLTDRTRTQKISKGMIEQDSIIHHLDLIDIYGILHPLTVERKVFLSSKGRFTKLEHTLGHKTHLNQFKRIEII